MLLMPYNCHVSCQCETAGCMSVVKLVIKPAPVEQLISGHTLPLHCSCCLLTLFAPAASFCMLQVPRTVVRRVSSEQEKQKLDQYELRSYVEDSKRLTWCPAPNCQHAVECMKDIGADEPLDVLCKCGSSFCFTCKEEAHRPVGSRMHSHMHAHVPVYAHTLVHMSSIACLCQKRLCLVLS